MNNCNWGRFSCWAITDYPTSLNPDPATSAAPWRIYNIGSNNPINLLRYIEIIEDALGVKAKKEFLPMQPGDVPDSLADLEKIKSVSGYQPKVSYKEGVKKFIEWYKHFYKVS